MTQSSLAWAQWFQVSTARDVLLGRDLEQWVKSGSALGDLRGCGAQPRATGAHGVRAEAADIAAPKRQGEWTREWRNFNGPAVPAALHGQCPDPGTAGGLSK